MRSSAIANPKLQELYPREQKKVFIFKFHQFLLGEFDIKKYITHKYTQNPLFIAYALASAEEAFQVF